MAKSAGSDVQSFYYDGQMPIETAEVGSSATTVTRNSLEARGIDRIEQAFSNLHLTLNMRSRAIDGSTL